MKTYLVIAENQGYLDVYAHVNKWALAAGYAIIAVILLVRWWRKK